LHKTDKIIPLRRSAEFYFKIAMKYANKKSIDKAVKYFEKAIEIEPFNAEYQFNLACILVEMKQVERSNEILLGILANIDPAVTECYFGIGCNYFDLGNFKKAKEYIEKYIINAPEGQFAEEAYDILYYLRIYYDIEVEKNRDESVKKIEEDLELQKIHNSSAFKEVKEEKSIIIKAGQRSAFSNAVWKKEWETIIDCAIKNKEQNYADSYGNDLKDIWMGIIRKYPSQKDIKIRKREVWAAALEYIYCSLNFIEVTKTKIAHKYNISTSSLSLKLKDINRE